MFTKVERLISSRNLRPKKKEGFLKIISIFSFFGIMLGVAILIIVMSVMNGFKTDLTKKILGLNPHIVIQPNSFNIDDKYISNLKNQFPEINVNKSSNHERLYRLDHKYDIILVIKYNFKKVIPGKGSAIFIHLTNNYKPTAGCIALKKKDF